MTFKEFSTWANQRACDGLWSIDMAVTCSNIIHNIYKHSKRKLKREKYWQEKYQSDVENTIIKLWKEHYHIEDK